MALSYVWGNVLPFETQSHTLNALLAENNSLILAWGQIPRVIQDAIVLTSALDETYLWVDSICIVQNIIQTPPTGANGRNL